MSRLFTSGFELNSLTNGVEFDLIDAPVADPGLSVQGITKRSGNYALKLKCNGSTNVQQLCKNTLPTMAAGRTYYARIYFYITTLPEATKKGGFWAIGDSTLSNFFAFTVFSDASLTIWEPTLGTIATISSAFTTGQWYRLEFSYAYTSGAFACLIDGISVASGTATASFALATVGMGNTGDCVTGEWYFDDIAVNDDQGSYQNSWPGSGKVLMLRPNATGDSAGWSRGGTDSGANWSQCNNIPPNDHTSYISVSANATDMYNVDSPALSTGATVKVVEVGGRFARSASTSPGIKFRCIKQTSGTESLSAEITPDNTQPAYKTNTLAAPRTSPIRLYLDPDSGVWTPTTIDSMQIGVVETTDTNRTVYVSEVWAIVEYMPALLPSVSQSVKLTEVVGAALAAAGIEPLVVSTPVQICKLTENLAAAVAAQVARGASASQSAKLTEVVGAALGAAEVEAMAVSTPFQAGKVTEEIAVTVAVQPAREASAAQAAKMTEVVAAAVGAQVVLNPSVTQTAKATEEITVETTTPVILEASVADSAKVTEDTAAAVAAQVDVDVSASQSARVADYIASPIWERFGVGDSVQISLEGVVSDVVISTPVDTVEVTEEVVLSVSAQATLGIEDAETVKITEDLTAIVTAQPTLEPSVGQSARLSENLAAAVPTQVALSPSRSDTVKVSEDIAASVSVQPARDAGTVDTGRITEDLGIAVAAQTTLEASIADTVRVTEARTVAVEGELAVLEVAVSETVKTSEAVTVSIIAQVALELAATDSIRVIDNASAAVAAQPDIETAIADYATLTEMIAAVVEELAVEDLTIGLVQTAAVTDIATASLSSELGMVWYKRRRRM